MTIILAEDNALDAELTMEAFSEMDFPIDIIHLIDGQEVLDYLFKEGKYINRESPNPNLILLDLKMPKVDGLEVLEKVKKDEKFKKIPIIMLTSSREENDLVKSYDLGVNAYVVKPLDFEVFRKEIQDIGMFWAKVNEPPPGL